MQTTQFVVRLAAAILLPFSAASAGKIRYVVTAFDVAFQPVGISDTGVVIGTSFENGVSTAATFKAGVVTSMGTPGGSQSYGIAITPNGDLAIGQGFTTNDAEQRYYVFAPDLPASKSLLPVAQSMVAINNHAQIVGWSNFDVGGQTRQLAFRYDYQLGGNLTPIGPLNNGSFTRAVAVNSGNVTVGDADVAGIRVGFVQAGGGLNLLYNNLFGTGDRYVYGINTAGVVVGSCRDAQNRDYAVAWTNNAPAVLPSLPGEISSYAAAINDSGVIVGASEDVTGWRAFVVRDGAVALLDEQTRGRPAGWRLSEPFALNAAGQILTRADEGSFTRYALLTPETVDAPMVKVIGKSRITTAAARLTVKGKATGEVTAVSYRVGKAKARSARGTARWKFSVPLKPGKTLLTITATGYGGSSIPVKVRILRN